MGSKQSTADYILEQLTYTGATARKMFGEYGIFCDGRMVAVICDDQLFLRDTKAGRALIDDPQTAPPYKGAKPWLVITPEMLEDADGLCNLVRASLPEVPIAGSKKKKTEPRVGSRRRKS
jgi:TfoX/Sxy family transcriptional regulator of competence genes